MAVKRYDGSAWQTVAGLGAQGAAATSSSIATWVKTASGGETSLSGNDDNSQALSYTVGQELVFINGVLQKRGADYTANTGNSITGLSALTANDIVSVWTVNAFSVSNSIANTIVDAKGDILVGTGADTPGRLAVGTNGQVLTAASTTGTGLAWATLPSSGKVLQVVYADTTTQVNIASTSYTDTGLSASITPSSTSSKVLVLIAANAGLDRSSNTGQGATFQLLRGSTAVMVQQASAVSALFIRAAQGNPATNMAVIMPLNYLDSPATTSSVTYKLQGKLLYTQDSGNLSNQVESTRSTIILLEIGA